MEKHSFLCGINKNLTNSCWRVLIISSNMLYIWPEHVKTTSTWDAYLHHKMFLWVFDPIVLVASAFSRSSKSIAKWIFTLSCELYAFFVLNVRFILPILLSKIAALPTYIPIHKFKNIFSWCEEIFEIYYQIVILLFYTGVLKLRFIARVFINTVTTDRKTTGKNGILPCSEVVFQTCLTVV